MTEDPRPLRGEPLPLDLLNTRWVDDTGDRDLLTDLDGLAIWLVSVGLEGVEPSAATLDALLVARTALHEVVRAEAGARRKLNEVLAHGHLGRRLGEAGPETVVETDTPGWQAAWRAADGYLRLLEARPERIRECANPDCPLRFYDVSKAGVRRWCSMAACGNRAKSRSHYARRHRD